MRPCYWHDELQKAVWERWRKAQNVWDKVRDDVFWHLYARRPPVSGQFSHFNPDPALLKEAGCSEEQVAAAQEYLDARSTYVTEQKYPCRRNPCPHCSPVVTVSRCEKCNAILGVQSTLTRCSSCEFVYRQRRIIR
jgi:hypothetical protein